MAEGMKPWTSINCTSQVNTLSTAKLLFKIVCLLSIPLSTGNILTLMLNVG